MIFVVSSLLVALAEMGDRTQLLAILLASRFRKPAPILLGILAATLANHALAALAGYYVSSLLTATWFKYVISISFIAMALWALVPDKEDDNLASERLSHAGVFLATPASSSPRRCRSSWWRWATRPRWPPPPWPPATTASFGWRPGPPPA
jgi:putative Ca2+/H+ antiporter (TMEM165/GDT1 family)